MNYIAEAWGLWYEMLNGKCRPIPREIVFLRIAFRWRVQPVELLFWQDDFDAVSRVRRGRLYQRCDKSSAGTVHDNQSPCLAALNLNSIWKTADCSVNLNESVTIGALGAESDWLVVSAKKAGDTCHLTLRRLFEWPAGYPENEAEFEKLMWAVDSCLYAEGLEPELRLYGFQDRLAEAMWCGEAAYPDDACADLPGYEGGILAAKGRGWYQEVYGGRLLTVYKLGCAPIRLGNALWRVRIPQRCGLPCWFFADRNLDNLGKNGDGKPLRKDSLIVATKERAHVNCLCLVEDLTQGMAKRLSDEEIAGFLDICRFAIVGLSWLVNLFWRVYYNDGGLFFTAFRDYAASTDSLLNGRYEQSRWDSEQAVEKILKGLFLVAKGKKHRNTHDLGELANSLEPFLAKAIDNALINDVSWSTDGRYAERFTTADECFRANHAVLKIAKQLSEDDSVKNLLEGVRKKGTP